MAGEMFIALESTSQEIKTAVEGVKTDVAGVNTDVDGVKNDTENIISQLTGGSGTIRHIQRGVLPGNTQSQISIGLDGFTNENKMIAFVNMCDNSTAWRPIAFSLTTTQLLIKGAGPTMSWGFYQIIEFC